MTRRITLRAACGLAVLAAVLAWKGTSKSPVGFTFPQPDSRGANPAVSRRVARSAPTPPSGLPRPQLSPYAVGTKDHDEWVNDRAEQLVKLSWKDDGDSLKQILTELGNPEQEIRKAALQAAANFGSRDAIPYLESLVGTSSDAEEKISLIQTAEQLKMPTASEYFAQKKTGATK